MKFSSWYLIAVIHGLQMTYLVTVTMGCAYPLCALLSFRVSSPVIGTAPMHIYHITYLISMERYLSLICAHLDQLCIYLGKNPDEHMRMLCTDAGSACVIGVQLISALETEFSTFCFVLLYKITVSYPHSFRYKPLDLHLR